ncbi:MAG TPA: 2'-5' RNA ligase family protein [Elusimicrobiota bacterium]|nr:2'-5' RNA ligase family protein [Elusimicrobiota bacterium]
MRLAAAAVLLALAGRCAAAGLTCPADAVDAQGKGKLLLFSSLPLGKTGFASKWAKVQKEVAKKFPGLRFEKPENLHVTLAFMGAGWDPAKIDEMERLGLEGPDLSSGTLKTKGTPEFYGDRKEVVALTLSPIPREWATRLMKKRQAMTDEGLRKLDKYDGVFKAHVSLASAPKPGEQREELARFQKWTADNAKRLGGLEIAFDRSIKPEYDVVLGKAETTRFVPLREVCAPPPAK